MSSLPTPAVRDRIALARIGVFAHQGQCDDEHRLGERFYISVSMGLDLTEAGRSDDLGASVSYAEIAELVQEIALGRRFGIVEALAEAIATAVLDGFARVAEVTVTVDRPNAAVAVLLDSVSVTTTRGR